MSASTAAFLVAVLAFVVLGIVLLAAVLPYLQRAMAAAAVAAVIS